MSRARFEFASRLLLCLIASLFLPVSCTDDSSTSTSFQRAPQPVPFGGTLPSLADVPNHSVPISTVIGTENTFGWPMALRSIDDLLFVIDGLPVGSDDYLLVIQPDTGEILTTGAPKGEGPGEVSDPRSIDVDPRYASTVSLYDYPIGRFTTFQYDKLELTPVSYLVQRHTTFSTMGFWLDDTTLVLNGTFPDHILEFYALSDDRRTIELDHTAGVGVYPDEPLSVRGRVNLNVVAIRPDGLRIAVAYLGANRIQVFDNKGEMIQQMAGPEDVDMSYSVAGFDVTFGWQLAYTQVAATQEHIYALFSGLPDQGNHSDTVHIFTWDGRLVEILHLDQGVYLMTVSLDGHSLFGVCFEPDYPTILQYGLRIDASTPDSATELGLQPSLTRR